MAESTITIGDIDKWNPDEIDRVFRVCTQQSDHCDERASGLGNLSVFESWDGDAAGAAKQSVGKTGADFDSHGRLVAAIATAAKTAATEVATVKSKLAGLRTQAQQQGFGIDNDGTVQQLVDGPFTVAEQEKLNAERTALQLEVNQLLINAQIADADLAAAIEGADGSMPLDKLAAQNHAPIYASVFGLSSLGIPDYPDQSLDGLQTRNYYNAAERRIDGLMDELAEDPNLSLEERAEIGWALRNELRTRARELMSDQEAASVLFRDRPNQDFEQLLESKMARKGMTREQALQDIIDTSSTSNADVNASLGVDPKTAQFPDPKDVTPRAGAPSGEDIGEDVVPGAAGDSKLLTGLRVAGKVALPVVAAATIYGDYRQVQHGQESVPQAVGHSGGTIAGMISGGEVGAAIGTAIGPEGTVVGGVVGGLVGSVAGAIGGGAVGKWIGGLF